MIKNYIAKMTGYKGTNADMTCTPKPGVKFQFELGKWYEHKGALDLCGSGFHFCVHPSGPYAFYNDTESRIFKIEAEQVLDLPGEPGADFKLVAKRIRLVEEITPGYRGKDEPDTGHWNTGNWNTGNRNAGHQNAGDLNTGDRNTGDQNTGNWNTGDRNTGDQNTGDRNTGDQNTGDRNTGNRNTGNLNTGHRNTGHQNAGDLNTGDLNTGDLNTGDLNTGNWNTGNWNTTNRASGFFCTEEPKVLSFDVQTNLTYSQFLDKYPEAHNLGALLKEEEKIRFEDFKNIPGITEAKLEKLHQQYLAGRK